MLANAPEIVAHGTTPRRSKKNRSSATNGGESDDDEDTSGEVLDQTSEPLTPTARHEDSVNGTLEIREEETKGESTDGPDSKEAPYGEDESFNASDRTDSPDGQITADSELSVPTSINSESRFDALVRDRDCLRVEVTEMRKSLENIQLKHQEEMGILQQNLDESESKKEHAEHQFQKLLERVNTIKSQLGERLKEDAVCLPLYPPALKFANIVEQEELALSRSRIEKLEEQNSNLKNLLHAKTSEIDVLHKEAEGKSKELSSLRNRTNLSQQNWLKEKEELSEQEAYLRSEFEEAKQAMHNWEVLAMEERSIRESLAGKVIDLEEQLASLKDAYEKAIVDSSGQVVTIDGLQRALQELQIARKQELRELVESSDAQLDELRHSLQDAKKKALEANSTLQTAQRELERLLPFEREVKEKNLLIGKLRHEAVTLNDHLTKALRFLKRGKPDDNVDRHIVTNHFLHFLALDRSDPKKFQVLQLIAALLNWTDEQREQAGLARPGTSAINNTLRASNFSIHRTPSTPSLVSEFFDSGATSKESLAELWSNFLEQEAQTGKETKES
ncbi:hypothetical protein Egran_05727 [Elaphomyces granulatus]|uniref:GRIP domain-containing protein n=1 Tax=Elaphomyces granulatus TaxID=519963 RepID=A0A232LQR0_9EURO|nr:hypothetical protein Egran_05727 [Elaphomyces granulatus]